MNHYYATSFPAPLPARSGKNLGFTDWTHAGAVAPPPAAACMDRVDNDADGAIDFPNDPGCTDFTDTAEDSEVLPAPPGAPATGGGDEPTPTRPPKKRKKAPPAG